LKANFATATLEWMVHLRTGMEEWHIAIFMVASRTKKNTFQTHEDHAKTQNNNIAISKKISRLCQPNYAQPHLRLMLLLWMKATYFNKTYPN
jgi:hypothetical protein